MGGGDLNLKKSWHPNTMKNQERVWKAEQADAEEKRKLNELQAEISHERNREELKRIGQTSGVLATPDDCKLEWMYKGQQMNREEYLIGRSIDKNFERMQESEQNDHDRQVIGITVPKNHVEHECVPFSIRQFRGTESHEQVDLQRKLMEDPLMAIKQQEMESRKTLLKNPVKLKELHRLLAEEKQRKSRKKQKSKKSKRKSSDSDSDLDKLLESKFKKLRNVMSEKEMLPNLLKIKEKKKKRRKSSSLSSDREQPKHRKSLDNRSHINIGRTKAKSPTRSTEIEDRSRSPKLERKSNRNRSKSPRRNPFKTSPKQNVRHRSKSKSPIHNKRLLGNNRISYRNRSKSPKRENHSDERRKSRPESRSPMRKGKTRDRSRSQSNDRRTHRRRRSTSPKNVNSLHSQQFNDSDEDNRSSRKRNYGLISADGSKMELKNSSELLKSSKPTSSSSTSTTTNAQHYRPKKALTEEEKADKLREMMDNAKWRDQTRAENVKKYRDEDRIEEHIDKSVKYNSKFIGKELHKAMLNEDSVESRLKANRNNIQRSSNSMNANFAKR